MPYTPWPSSLTQTPNRQGFQRGPMPGVVIFEPEAGPVKRRRRHTAEGKVQTHTFEMSGAQVTIFENFYDNDIASGSLPFLWQGPRDEVATGWVFDTQNPYTITAIGSNWWNLSITIERLP